MCSGTASDPLKMAENRALQRVWIECLEADPSGPCAYDNPVIQNFTWALLKAPEHTWVRIAGVSPSLLASACAAWPDSVHSQQLFVSLCVSLCLLGHAWHRRLGRWQRLRRERVPLSGAVRGKTTVNAAYCRALTVCLLVLARSTRSHTEKRRRAGLNSVSSTL